MLSCGPLIVLNDVERVVGDVCESIPSDVDEIKLAFHVSGHVACVARQFLPDIFFEGSPAPSAHLLDLDIGVSAEG